MSAVWVCLWLCVLSHTTFIGKGVSHEALALPVCPGGTSMLKVPSWKLRVWWDTVRLRAATKLTATSMVTGSLRPVHVGGGGGRGWGGGGRPAPPRVGRDVTPGGVVASGAVGRGGEWSRAAGGQRRGAAVRGGGVGGERVGRAGRPGNGGREGVGRPQPLPPTPPSPAGGGEPVTIDV